MYSLKLKQEDAAILMGYGMNQLPRKVASLAKKLAKLQREKIEYIKSCGGYRHGDTAFSDHLGMLGEKGDRLIDDLLSTCFVFDEIGILDPDDEYCAENFRAIAEYFLSLYAEERQEAEINGEKYDEDLFYAAGYLIHEAQFAEDLATDGIDNGKDEPDEDDEADILAMLGETFGSVNGKEEKKQPEGKVIQMFGENKGKKK